MMPMNSPLHSRSRSNLSDSDRASTGGEAMNYFEEAPLIGPEIPKKPGNSSVAVRALLPRMQIYFFAAWAFICLKVAKDSVSRMETTELRSKFFYEAFLYYNPLFMVAMMVWFWGINLCGFFHFRVNYAKVFDLEQNHLTHKQIWKIASWMTILVLTSMTAYLYLYSHGEVNLAASQPVILYCALLLLLLLPADVLYSSSRFYFVNVLLRIILPLQPITFSDFFVADVLTSMSKVLSDIERSICRMYNRQVATIAWFEADDVCGSHSIRIPCMLALPYLFRLAQCLRQYSDTRDRSCLFNALKYSTSIPVIFLSALKYHVPREEWEGFYRPLWLFSSVVNSFFSFYWDITRDWDFGLYFRSKFALRSTLVYNPRWVYHWAIGSNLLLRCAWTYKLSAHLRHNYLTVFTFSALEMMRRFQWTFFRVENEHNKIILRSSPSPSPPKSSDESEMVLLASAGDHIV